VLLMMHRKKEDCQGHKGLDLQNWIPAFGCVEKHRKCHSEERSDVAISLSFNS